MRSVFVVAMLVPLLALAGCAKRTAKKPANDDSAAVTPAPAAGDKKEKPKDDAPNWLTDPRFKKEKSKADEPVPAQGASNKQPWGVSPPQGGWQGATPAPNATAAQPNPPPAQPAPGPMPAPGKGVLQPEPQPARPPAPTTPVKFSPVSEADMKEVWIFIENASLASGKMPPRITVFQALIAAESPAAKLVKDGSIILTGTPAREGIWAFETRAITDGGLVASQNGVERLTAAQLKARLGK